MKIFVRASIAAAVLLAATLSHAAFPTDVTALMDTTVDPCDDFYQYTCGNWVKNYTLTDSERMFEYSFQGVSKRNQVVILDIIKEKPPLIGEFWDSCMGLDKMTALGTKPIERDMSRIAAATTKRELAIVAGDLGGVGPKLLVGAYVTPDMRNATVNVLKMAIPSPVLPDASYYLDNSTFASVEAPYRKYISTLVKLGGIKTKACNGEQVEDIVIKIETKLAEIRPTPEEYQKDDQLKYSEAAAKYPLTFAAKMEGMGLIERSSVTTGSTIFFQSLPFMDRVEKLMNSLDLDELKLYYSYLYLFWYARYLGEPFVAADFAFFDQTLEGTQARRPRENVCKLALMDSLPDLIGEYYYQKDFDSDREEKVKVMVSAIEKAMGKQIEAVSWLDEPTRKQAKAKLAKVTGLIAHSTQKKSYPKELSREDYLYNVQTIWNSTWSRFLRKINNPVDNTEWGISPATVSAYFSRPSNQIVLPAAILQPPFFNVKSHPVQGFGAIGAVVGHELTHGFDSVGRLYDADGNFINWWSDKSAKEFESRAQCMSDQYSQFVALGDDGKPVGNVNGELTLDENIADNGGLSLAYDAYQEWVKSGGNVSSHGVQDDEVDKLSFVSFGQMWCTKIRDEALAKWLRTSTHSPGMWRVNGVLMKSDAFAKTYQCKAGSKMNPATKCKLWQT